MTEMHLVLKWWVGILGSMLAFLPLGCAQQTGPCTDPVPVEGDQWVTKQECPGLADQTSTLIRIDSARPNSELWVLEELEDGLMTIPLTPTGVGFHGRLLNHGDIQARSQALVQMNGFTFSCYSDNRRDFLKSCYRDANWRWEYPVTTVYESTKRLATSLLTPEEMPDGYYMLKFNPRNAGRLIELGPEGVIPGNETDLGYYNAVGNVWPLIVAGRCIPGPRDDWTVLGFSATHVIMLYIPDAALDQDTCDFLVNEFGVINAFQMDGAGSAGLSLRDGTSAGHTAERFIPYRIGLVTLETDTRVENGGFEEPDLSLSSTTYPTGFHSYAGQQIVNHVKWNGAMFLYNTSLYHDWVRGHPRAKKKLLPSLGAQVAAIRPRGDDTNHITQDLRDVPDNRYCMLHFYHGYHKPNGCNENKSELTVTAGPCSDSATPSTTAVYESWPTHGLNPQLLLDNEVWLRLLTPSSGECMRVTFTASRPHLDETSGNCEVLLDDVSVSCAQ